MRITKKHFASRHLPSLVLLAVAAASWGAEVGDISPSESTALERRVATKNFVYAGFGPSTLLGLDHDGLGYHTTTGIQREATPNAAIRGQLGFDFSPGMDAWESDATLGMAYFFSRGDFSPLVGASFGWGTAHGRSWSGGFALAATVGIQAFRTATTQLSLEGGPRLILDRNVDGYPVAWSLGLNLFM